MVDLLLWPLRMFILLLTKRWEFIQGKPLWRILDGNVLRPASGFPWAQGHWEGSLKRKGQVLAVYVPRGGLFRRAKLIGAAKGWTIKRRWLGYGGYFLVDSQGGSVVFDPRKLRDEGPSCDTFYEGFDWEMLLRGRSQGAYMRSLTNSIGDWKRQHQTDQQQREKDEIELDLTRRRVESGRQRAALVYALAATWLRACKGRTLNDTRIFIVTARDLLESYFDQIFLTRMGKDGADILKQARWDVEAAKKSTLAEARTARATKAAQAS